MPDKIKVQLSGEDGNAFAIIARCSKAARKGGMDTAEWEKIMEEMMAGDYDHLIATAMKHFDVK
jgi:hypothetical protein